MSDGDTQTTETHSLEELAEIEKQVIAQIEGQNWTDKELSDWDKNLIGMAVSATAYILAERKSAPMANEPDTRSTGWGRP